jgi:hypothetical protein
MGLVLALCVWEPLAFSLNRYVQIGSHNLLVRYHTSVHPLNVAYSLPVALSLSSVNLAWVTL